VYIEASSQIYTPSLRTINYCQSMATINMYELEIPHTNPTP
jgi:hypothetical protein